MKSRENIYGRHNSTTMSIRLDTKLRETLASEAARAGVGKTTLARRLIRAGLKRRLKTAGEQSDAEQKK